MARAVSRPIRSSRRSGPIGWAQPRTMPLSMSSADAKPDSSIRIADSRYGTSSALTMKPARSCARITCLRERSGEELVGARGGRRSSSATTRPARPASRTGTGLKKWMPMTCSGRFVAMASFMIGIDDVLDARIASGLVDDRVECGEHVDLDRLVLGDRLDHQIPVGEGREFGREGQPGQRGVAVRRVELAVADRAVERRGRRAVGRARGRLRTTRSTTTSRPARAHTSAMPEPISPQPTTPIRSSSVLMSAPF